MPYKLISRIHENRYMADLQSSVAGWAIQARWLSTGTILPVFIPDTAYTPANVDAAIRAAGKHDDAIAALGG